MKIVIKPKIGYAFSGFPFDLKIGLAENKSKDLISDLNPITKLFFSFLVIF